MRISLLVPCFNEERSLEATIQSCLNQERPFDQIVFVDDSSTDKSPEILAKYADRILVHRTPRNTGNKSSAQEFGLGFVDGDVVVMTDADTLLKRDFARVVEESFADETVSAVAGHVVSIPHNWLTLCRAFEYTVGQRIHKRAQQCLRYIFVMPGAASAFRKSVFGSFVTFDHDTITEDLDFTYKMHRQGLRVEYNPNLISYTQDPTTLSDYVNQLRRWFGGGWQNLKKHYEVSVGKPSQALELSLIYSEGLLFSMLVFLLPALNPVVGLFFFAGYFGVMYILAIWATFVERRPGMLLVPPVYLLLIFVNAYVYLEQFWKEIVLGKQNLSWFKPERIKQATS